MPASEISIQPRLIRQLLRSQLPPELGYLLEAPLHLVGEGWDNVICRLGETHLVRLPQRRIAADMAAHEIAWVEVASEPIRALGLTAPIPVFAGSPGPLFPWPWSIVPWIPGEDVSRLPLARRDGLIAPLARALVALHRPAPREAPRNPYRGVPLAERARAVNDRWPAVSHWLTAAETEYLRSGWERALAAAPWPGPAHWVHGDVHPRNLLQVDGRLVGMIDFGDVGAGDPAVDFAVAWLAFDPGQRERFWSIVRSEGSYDDAIRTRANGWAVVLYTAMIADPVTRRNLWPMLEDIRTQIQP